ncbi:MAG: outer membrane protein assembly factor BamD [Ignavibacteriae bacterium]|nr:MAG: outer membrane protein assembly factor BamD [Ignavibacteriota bacterium]
MKLLSLLLLIVLAVWRCSSSLNTTDFGPEERLNYAISLYEDEDYQDALTEFQALLLQYPGSIIVDDTQYYLGMTRYQRDEYIVAAYEFSKLIRNMPASEFVPKAQYMLAQSYYQLSPNFNLDQQYTKKAIVELQAFIDYFPLNEKVAEAENQIIELNKKLAKKEYNTAVIYEKLEYYKAAIKYLNNVIDTYHDTQYAAMASYKKILLLMDREREDEAYAEMKKFLLLYPDDENYVEIEEMKNSLDVQLKGNFSTN